MHKAKERQLASWTQPGSLIAEQFRAIRTNIQFSSLDQPIKTIAVTSPGAAEGKSTIAANLAISISQQGKKVLLVDANARKSTIHTMFNLPNRFGFADILQGTFGWKDAIQTTTVAQLEIITMGSIDANSGEWPYTQVMREWLHEAKISYDTILLDCPSILDYTDARMIAHHCDGVILVVRNGKTKLEKAKEAKSSLEFGKANILGVILNDKE